MSTRPRPAKIKEKVAGELLIGREKINPRPPTMLEVKLWLAPLITTRAGTRVWWGRISGDKIEDFITFVTNKLFHDDHCNPHHDDHEYQKFKHIILIFFQLLQSPLAFPGIGEGSRDYLLLVFPFPATTSYGNVVMLYVCHLVLPQTLILSLALGASTKKPSIRNKAKLYFRIIRITAYK